MLLVDYSSSSILNVESVPSMSEFRNSHCPRLLLEVHIRLLLATRLHFDENAFYLPRTRNKKETRKVTFWIVILSLS